MNCDASPTGVGAVLSHVLDDGSEKPIAFASRTLSKAERNYAQLDREALAIIFGVKQFHKYVYGRDFTIFTDHLPLLGILQEGKMMPIMCSPRMKRWSLMLTSYMYSLRHKSGVSNGNADALSRLPLDVGEFNVPIPEEVVLTLTQINETPVTAAKIKQWTAHDPVLSAVYKCVQQGWPNASNEVIDNYFSRRHEITVHDGCLLWGSRVIVPPQGRSSVLQELHHSHPGIVKMKNLARSYVWWPGIDNDIEQCVRQCEPCKRSVQSPSHAQVHPWEWPGIPWYRIHIDYAGPINGKYILVITDAHSKYIDAFITDSTSTEATVRKLRQCFATHGLPVVLVSDNGSGFTSADFQLFCNNNGIKHVFSAPYHPAGNGAAEAAVKIVKNGIAKLAGDMETRLFTFLARYRVTPHTVTGRTPAELLMSRIPRSRINLVVPDLRERVLNKQSLGNRSHRSQRDFCTGDTVSVRNFAGSPTWMPGVIQDQTGPVTFTIALPDGRIWRRHVDHILRRAADEKVSSVPVTSTANFPSPPVLQTPPTVATEPITQPPSTTTVNDSAISVPETLHSPMDSSVTITRSGRRSVKPDRLNV